MKIISGMCSGADIGGTIAAHRLGYPTGGWVWNHEEGKAKGEWAKYGVEAVPSGESRTRWNALAADATLHFKEGGEMVTWGAITESGKGFSAVNRPWFEVKVENYNLKIEDNVVKACQAWLDRVQPLILNIAGNADHRMQEVVEDFMERLLPPFKGKD